MNTKPFGLTHKATETQSHREEGNCPSCGCQYEVTRREITEDYRGRTVAVESSKWCADCGA